MSVRYHLEPRFGMLSIIPGIGSILKSICGFLNKCNELIPRLSHEKHTSIFEDFIFIFSDRFEYKVKIWRSQFILWQFDAKRKKCGIKYLRKNNNEFALMKKTHFYVFQINIQSVKKIDDEVRQS